MADKFSNADKVLGLIKQKTNITAVKVIKSRGTLKIINSSKEAGLSEPVIKEMNGGVEVTIFSHPNLETSKQLRNDFGTTFKMK